MTNLLGQAVLGQAVFSPCRRYRFALWRTWALGPSALFVGLNPSTANEDVDDPTIRRCVRFARDWGYGGLCMVNLFALVSTDPRALLEPDPVQRRDHLNDRYIERCAARAGVVIAAWGAFPQARDRASAVIDAGLLGDYRVLGLTKAGHPRHPLYMRAACRPLHPTSLQEAA